MIVAAATSCMPRNARNASTMDASDQAGRNSTIAASVLQPLLRVLRSKDHLRQHELMIEPPRLQPLLMPGT